MTQQNKELTQEQRIALIKELAKLGALLTKKDINAIRCPYKPDTETRPPLYVGVVAIEAVLKAYPHILAKADKAKAGNNDTKPKRQQKPPLLDSKGRLLAIIKAEREGKDINLTVVREIAVAQAQWDLWNEAIYGSI